MSGDRPKGERRHVSGPASEDARQQWQVSDAFWRCYRRQGVSGRRPAPQGTPAVASGREDINTRLAGTRKSEHEVVAGNQPRRSPVQDIGNCGFGIVRQIRERGGRVKIKNLEHAVQSPYLLRSTPTNGIRRSDRLRQRQERNCARRVGPQLGRTGRTNRHFATRIGCPSPEFADLNVRLIGGALQSTVLKNMID
jgi:hypothetical protein